MLYVADAEEDGTVPIGITAAYHKYLDPDEALAFGIEVIVQAVAAARRAAERAAAPPKVNFTAPVGVEPAWIGEVPPQDLSATLRERIARSEFRTTRG